MCSIRTRSLIDPVLTIMLPAILVSNSKRSFQRCILKVESSRSLAGYPMATPKCRGSLILLIYLLLWYKGSKNKVDKLKGGNPYLAVHINNNVLETKCSLAENHDCHHLWGHPSDPHISGSSLGLAHIGIALHFHHTRILAVAGFKEKIKVCILHLCFADVFVSYLPSI